MILGYIRVSTREQKTSRQEEALEGLCDEVVVEKLSAAAERRPIFDEAISRLEAGDTFVVLDLDRAFRSTVDAITTADKLKAKKVNFKVLNSPIDTTTEYGELVFTIIAALAQAERKITRRRTREGLAVAKSRGITLGRPRKLRPDQIQLARRTLEAGDETMQSMAAILKVDRKTLYRALKRGGGSSHNSPPAVQE